MINMGFNWTDYRTIVSYTEVYLETLEWETIEAFRARVQTSESSREQASRARSTQRNATHASHVAT